MSITQEVAREANAAASVGYHNSTESPFVIHCSYSSSSPAAPNEITIQAHLSVTQAIAIMRYARAILEDTNTIPYHYEYRSYSFSDVGGANAWCVAGETLNADGTVGSMGVQEWCTSERDAENLKALMEMDTLFRNLRICRSDEV